MGLVSFFEQKPDLGIPILACFGQRYSVNGDIVYILAILQDGYGVLGAPPKSLPLFPAKPLEAALEVFSQGLTARLEGIDNLLALLRVKIVKGILGVLMIGANT
jgi:hypothetical protein